MAFLDSSRTLSEGGLTYFGRLAQLVERCVYIANVGGSSPSASTNRNFRRFGKGLPRGYAARYRSPPRKKFSLHFLICERPIFSSKRKRKLFCWVLLSTSRAAGLRFGSGEAEFPPRPPSASPSLWIPTEFVFCFAKCAARKGVALAPALPCVGNDKELPNFV